MLSLPSINVLNKTLCDSPGFEPKEVDNGGEHSSTKLSRATACSCIFENAMSRFCHVRGPRDVNVTKELNHGHIHNYC